MVAFDAPRELPQDARAIVAIDRIAALVPPPRIHRHRYCGVLAPTSPLRTAVTALAVVATTPAARTTAQPNRRRRTGPSPRLPLGLGARTNFASAPQFRLDTHSASQLARRSSVIFSVRSPVILRERRSYCASIKNIENRSDD